MNIIIRKQKEPMYYVLSEIDSEEVNRVCMFQLFERSFHKERLSVS